ncbi:MAG: hypothetical protein AAFW59_11065 [Pseudomonadota bacterium]
MDAGTAALFAGGACLILIGSAIWAHYRFADFDRLPRHFGPNLEPTAYGPRWLIIWLSPAIFLAVLGLIFVLPSVLPPEHINGDPSVGVIVASVVVVGAQAFVLWLLTRWARQQS